MNEVYGYAIKFDDGTYYAGCNKNNSKTLLGAQIYKGKKTVDNIMNKTINFPSYLKGHATIVKVLLCEVPD